MERRIFIVSLIVSIILHFSLAYILLSMPKQKKQPKEEKPIVVSFVKPKKEVNKKTSSTKRKIPKKTKLTTPSKTVIPKNTKKANKKQVKKTKKQQKKKKPEKKQPVKKIEKPKKVPALKKVNEKKLETKPKEKPKKPQEKKESVKVENPPVKPKETKEIPQIAQGKPKKEKKEEKKPDINVPLSEKINPKKEKEQPVKQLNLTHLQGKDQIFQMQSEDKPKKEEIVVEAKGDIKKYLFYVRDRLQENLAYPLMAKRLQIEGTVVVRFIIEKDGSVKEETIKIVKSSGSKILDRQAIITVKNSIPFKPPPEGRIVIEIPVVFEIIRSYY